MLSVVFNEDETHAESAAAAIDHRLFNEDGIIEWHLRVKSEDSLSADITDEDMEGE
ncbi:hypothetical protein M1D49_08015 [Bacillus sp. PK3-056]|uniref:hypothetical protein n=1 Tax=Niallia circulans TaxID=1397 RepID=UPI0013DE0F35|nr:hypothetical protein [Niallia circulans]